MKIQVRYAGTTKTPTVNYHIFADGLRIGFVKLDKTKEWQARDWVYRPIAAFPRRPDATNAVIENFQHFARTAPKKNVNAFKKHAIRFKTALGKPKTS